MSARRLVAGLAICATGAAHGGVAWTKRPYPLPPEALARLHGAPSGQLLGPFIIHFPPAAAAADFPDALRWLWRGYRPPP